MLSRESLAVQWLGLGAFTAVAQVQSLVGELRSCKLHGMARPKKKKKKSYLKHTEEPKETYSDINWEISLSSMSFFSFSF